MPHKRVAKCVVPVLLAKSNTPGRSRMVKNTEKSLVGNRRPNIVSLVIDNKSSF